MVIRQKVVMSQHALDEYRQQSIDFVYQTPSPTQIEKYKNNISPKMIDNETGISVVNAYFQIGYNGSLANLYNRLCVYQQIKQVLTELLPKTGLMLFDGFRTITTQQALFDDFQQLIGRTHPDWDPEQVLEHTRTFVSDPSLSSNDRIPPHNSGGAIDLTIYDISSGQPWDFGSAVDATTEISYTDFFEQPYAPALGISQKRWVKIRNNRRILYHLMISAGFTNYRMEWWHYDLGDRMWAEALQIPELFKSMEAEVASQAK